MFPVVWSLLYIAMGLASWLVYTRGGEPTWPLLYGWHPPVLTLCMVAHGWSGFEKQWLPLLLYAIQLALNLAWTPIFFGAHQLGFAFVEICFLWVAVLATIVAFAPIHVWAAVLLVPYLAWVSVATSIAAYIYYHNSPSTLTHPLSVQ